MKKFFRIFLIFLYACLAFFIKPAEAYAGSIYFSDIPKLHYISEEESNVTGFNETEQYYAVIQNNNNAQIADNNNKNNDLGAASGCGLLPAGNILKDSAFNKYKIFYNSLKSSRAENLKYTIAVRAP